ncbi:MAG: hypothetical protein R2681_13475 [Pyrinomonadaceae bacterium]
MNPVVRGILAVIVGVAAATAINMGIITVGNILIPPPAGVDLSTMEKMQETMHLFGVQHFITPFLAHALGTLSGALLASLIAASHKLKFALGIAVFSLIGGIAAVYLLPAPLWFEAFDLIFAYIPMGWLGWKLSGGN